jgi:hypothetical protein
MKKLLLITFSFLLIGQLQAQNWRPFNPSDTVRHYLAEDSTRRIGQDFTFFPILSTVIDSSFFSNGNAVYVFKKGFSYLEAVRLDSQGGLNNYQKIKGKILGDTATFYTDSTVVISLDYKGFKLNFPTSYTIGKNWLIGTKLNQKLSASVDSIYFDSIPDFDSIPMDSMVSIQLQLLDSTGNPVNNSSFNQKVILSKHHGLVRTIDFTDLETTHGYTLYPWETQNKTHYKHQEYYQLEPGDYFFSETLQGFAGYKAHKHTVVSDSIHNGIRTINMQVESSATTFYPFTAIPPSNYTFIPISSNNFSIQIKLDSNYRIKQSGLINDSNLFNHSTNYYTTPQFGLRLKWGERWPVEFQDGNLEISGMSFFPSSRDSIQIYVFEGSGVACPLIGVGNEYDGYSSQFGLQYWYESIFFLKKGNQTWGAQPLVVGLEDNPSGSSIKVYPNPASQTLFLSSSERFESIKAYGQNGRFVKEWRNSAVELDLDNLPVGLYFLQLQTQTGEIVNRKFVKQ